MIFTKNLANARKSFLVNSKEKAMASEISLSKDLIDMKARKNHPVCFETVLVYPCLFTDRTSVVLKSLLSLFFFPKLECGLYMNLYGILVLKEVFLERETNVFALQRHKRFFVCET